MYPTNECFGLFAVLFTFEFCCGQYFSMFCNTAVFYMSATRATFDIYMLWDGTMSSYRIIYMKKKIIYTG